MANIDHQFDIIKPGRTRTFDTGYGFVEVKGDDSKSSSEKNTSNSNSDK